MRTLVIGLSMYACSSCVRDPAKELCITQAFEWVVRDVHRLRDHVELAEQDGATADISGFEILNESPMLADGKFKLEIGGLGRNCSLICP